MLTIERSTVPVERAGTLLSEVFDRYKGVPVLFLSSGGSALSLLGYARIEDSKYFTLSILDERFTDDFSASNFSQFEETTFFRNAVSKGASFIDTKKKEGDTLASAASHFEDALRMWRQKYSDGIIIITQGFGADGHTAGIFTADKEVFEERFLNPERWVSGYEIPPGQNPYTKRITVTIPFLVEQVDVSLVYAVGNEKKGVLEKVDSREGETHDTPALVLNEMKEVIIVTDA